MPFTGLRGDLHWISRYSRAARRGSGTATGRIIEQMFAVLTTRVGRGLQFDLNTPQVGRLGEGTGNLGRAPKRYVYFLPGFGRVVDDGQKSLRMHSSHRGRRAMQIRRPCRINRSDNPVHSSGGTIEHTCRSILTGSRDDTSLSRLVRRITCVSTAKPGTLNPTPRMTLAVLRPMPGILSRSSMFPGTSPPNSSTRVLPAAMILRVLARKKPVGLMIASTSKGSAAARSK